MKHSVNRKAVIVLFCSVALLAVAIHFLHAYQVKRNARDVYEQALVMEQDGKLAQAADLLEQFLGLSPGDNEALARLAIVRDELAKTARARARAFYMLEQVLRRDPDRKDIRRRVVRVATKMGRYPDAEHHLALLLKDAPEDAELLQYKGRCLAGELKFDDADEWYRKALKAAPERVELAVEYASLLRNHLEMPTLADAQIEAMLSVNDKSPDAQRMGAEYFRRNAKWEQAEKHVKFALEKLGLEDADVLLLAADVARARGKQTDVRKYLERGRALYPKDTRLAQALARLELADGDRAKALRYLEERLANLPDDSIQLWQTAVVCVEAGMLDRAADIAKQLRKLNQLGPRAYAQCIEAQILMRGASWGAARKALEAIPLASAKSRDLSRQVPFLLALCYERLANPINGSARTRMP